MAYLFFNEPPKEVPHGYTCEYIPDSSNLIRSIQQAAGCHTPVLKSTEPKPLYVCP
jgi:hypothetical protein